MEIENKNKKILSTSQIFLINSLNGGFSSIFISLILYPYTRFRVSSTLIRTGLHQSYPPFSYSHFKRIIDEQGISYFWRGILTQILRAIPVWFLYFSLKDYIKLKLHNKSNKEIKRNENKNIIKNIISGGIAGLLPQIIWYPILRGQLRSLIPEKHIDYPLYKGFGRFIVSIIPYYSIYFGMYDSIIEYYPQFKNQHSYFNILGNFCVAVLSTNVASCVIHPIEVIQRRLSMDDQQPNERQRYKGMRDCFIKVYKDEGLRSFYRNLRLFTFSSNSNALKLFLFNQIYYKLNQIYEFNGSVDLK